MQTETDLTKTFTALGDTTRRAILTRLSEGEAALSEIAAPFDMSQTAVSKHVRILSDAGLVRVTKRGRTRYCSLDPMPIQAVSDWLETYRRFWESQLDSLARFLEEEEEDL